MTSPCCSKYHMPFHESELYFVQIAIVGKCSQKWLDKGLIIFTKSLLFLKMGISGIFFFIFVFSIQLIVNVQCKCLSMTGIKPRASENGSDCYTNWATTTAQAICYFVIWDSICCCFREERNVNKCAKKREENWVRKLRQRIFTYFLRASVTLAMADLLYGQFRYSMTSKHEVNHTVILPLVNKVKNTYFLEKEALSSMSGLTGLYSVAWLHANNNILFMSGHQPCSCTSLYEVSECSQSSHYLLGIKVCVKDRER